MNKTYVTNQVRNQLAAYVNNEGFEYIKSKQVIIRKHNMGFDGIYTRVIDYNPIFKIEPSIDIRINKVEEIVNQFLDERFTNPIFNHLSTTEGTSYAVLSGAKENCIEINNEEALNRAITELTVVIREKGLKFFEENRNIEKVNSFKKNRILDDKMGASRLLTNLMQSLTLMKLCKDSDFEKLSMKYREILIPWGGEEDASYEVLDNLISYLRGL